MLPEAVRAADRLARPARPRLRLAALAVARRAALAVGARGRRAAALAAAGIGGLAALGLLAGGVMEVAADGRGRAVEQVRDLGDRPALLAVVLGEQNVAPARELSGAPCVPAGSVVGRWVGHRQRA